MHPTHQSNRQARAFDALLAKHSPTAIAERRWSYACRTLLTLAGLAAGGLLGWTAYGLL